MDIERERSDPSEKTDDGYSEQKLAKQFDRGKSTKHTVKNGQIFTAQKKSFTLFQAQKDEEI